MREIIGPIEDMSFDYLKHFLNLNADLLRGLPIPHRHFENLLQDYIPPTGIDFFRFYRHLLRVLAAQTDRPVTNIFDEHNEIFRESSGQNELDRCPRFFEDFTRWTGKLSGVRLLLFSKLQNRNFTVYIGSAHSKFECQLPGGAENRLRHVQPLSKEEALVLFADKDSVGYFCLNHKPEHCNSQRFFQD
jgi:hypothetical protein